MRCSRRPYSFVLTQNFQNVDVSGVGAPYEVGAPSYRKSWIRHCLLIYASITFPKIKLVCVSHYEMQSRVPSVMIK